MKFTYNKEDPLACLVLGPLVEYFKQVNGRDPEPDDIACYCLFVPLQGIYGKFQTY
jgi:hypothetical protein